MCTDNIPIKETFYDFKAKEKGEYYFRFFQDNFDGLEFIMDTLKVE